MKIINWIAKIVILIGALNWGLVGFFHYNLVTALFPDFEIARIIYAVVGVAALWGIFACTKCCVCRK